MKNVDVIDESTFILVVANNTFKADNFDLFTHTCVIQIRKSDEICSTISRLSSEVKRRN